MASYLSACGHRLNWLLYTINLNLMVKVLHFVQSGGIGFSVAMSLAVGPNLSAKAAGSVSSRAGVIFSIDVLVLSASESCCSECYPACSVAPCSVCPAFLISAP